MNADPNDPKLMKWWVLRLEVLMPPKSMYIYIYTLHDHTKFPYGRRENNRKLEPQVKPLAHREVQPPAPTSALQRDGTSSSEQYMYIYIYIYNHLVLLHYDIYMCVCVGLSALAGCWVSISTTTSTTATTTAPPPAAGTDNSNSNND